MEYDFEIGDLVRVCRLEIEWRSKIGFIVDVVNIGYRTRWVTVLIDGDNVDFRAARVEVLSEAPRNGA